MEASALFLYAETPVHPGGESALGAIDLPIQREAPSGFPVIWGQSLKGALRQHARESKVLRRDEIDPLFGSDPDPTSGVPPMPGSLSVGDARLVAFPVPTLQHTFAWVTSPMVLERVRRIIRLARLSTKVRGQELALSPISPPPDTCIPADAQSWSLSSVALGSYALRVSTTGSAEVASWAKWIAHNALPDGEEFEIFRSKLQRDLLVADDATFAELTRDCAELLARVQLNDKKTVQNGPFYEEYLPVETILVSLLAATNGDHGADATRLSRMLDANILVLGGSETIGKGLLWCRYVPQQRDSDSSVRDRGNRPSEGRS